MWVANLYTDKGSTLASFIIKNDYKVLPDCICIPSIKKLYTFGGVCPKLKAIILKYKLRIREDTNLKNSMKALRF